MLRLLYRVLRFWHLLSLDAPTVAALWCWAFGRAARVRLAPWLPIALALGTWLFYVADRLLDARLSPPSALRERHCFHYWHRRAFLAVAAPVALALAALVAQMPRSLIAAYSVLGVLSLLYLGLVHLPLPLRRIALHSFPKEFAVALLFAAATALPAWDAASRHAAGMSPSHALLFLCPVFAALCWLTCLAIEDWEQHRSGFRIPLLALCTLAGCAFTIPAVASSMARELAAAALLSAALFLLLDHSRMAASGRRIAADLVLLTPLLLIAARLA